MQRTARAGLGFSIVAAATFGTSGTFAESLISAGWSPAGAVFARISVAALILTIPAAISLRGQWFLLRRSAGMIAAFGLIAVAACQVAYFNSVSRLSVGVSLLLEYLGVILVVLWLWFRHGQRPRRLTVIGAVVAMIGLVLVLNLTGAQHLDAVGVAWGLSAAVGLAIFFSLSARADEPLPPIALAWTGMVVGAVALLIAGATGLVDLRGSTADVDFAGHYVNVVVPIIGLSLIAAAIAYIASIEAARILGARLASFIGLTEVLFAVLFAWLLLGQLPGLIQLVGGVFIVAGVVLVRIDERTLPGPEPTFSGVPETLTVQQTPGKCLCEDRRVSDEPERDEGTVDDVGAAHPSFGRSLGVFWLYTLLRFGLFGALWVILWLVGLGPLVAAAIAVVLSIPLSWVLLARPRRALAANIEQRVNARVDRRAEFDDRLEGVADVDDDADR